MRKAEKVTTDSRDRPLDSNEVVIADSGTIALKAPFLVSETDAEDIELTGAPVEEDEDQEEMEEEEIENDDGGIQGPLADGEQELEEEDELIDHEDL